MTRSSLTRITLLLQSLAACASDPPPPPKARGSSSVLMRAKPVEWSAIAQACTGASGFGENPPYFETVDDALSVCERIGSPCACAAKDLMCDMRCKSVSEQTHASCALACEKGAAEGCTSLADAIAKRDSDCAAKLRDRAKDLRGEPRYEYVPVAQPV